MLEWLKRHAWKACNRQKRFGGSNPPLSAWKYYNMKRLIFLFTLIGLLSVSQTCIAQSKVDSVAMTDTTTITADADSMAVMVDDIDELVGEEAEGGLHKQLKTKFIDGNVAFMSLVALALVLGLAFCIERIIYLTLSEIKTHQLMGDIEQKLKANDSRLKGQKGVDFYVDNGMVKYTVGASENYNEIYHLRKSLLDKFPEAFIIAFKGGQRMDVQQAIKEFKNKRVK